MSRFHRKHRALLMLGAGLVCVGVAGCAASNATVDAPPTATTTDEETCIAFGDVLTITANAKAASLDGRMETQEQDGWNRLATRVLSRVPGSGEGAVSDALDALKRAAPAIPSGAVGDAGIDSGAWNDALGTFSQACTDGGYDVAIEGFTGG